MFDLLFANYPDISNQSGYVRDDEMTRSIYSIGYHMVGRSRQEHIRWIFIQIFSIDLPGICLRDLHE